MGRSPKLQPILNDWRVLPSLILVPPKNCTNEISFALHGQAQPSLSIENVIRVRTASGQEGAVTYVSLPICAPSGIFTSCEQGSSPAKTLPRIWLSSSCTVIVPSETALGYNVPYYLGV